MEALKKKPRSEDADLMHYCQLFASISRDLVLRQRLDRYIQCQWFLQGHSERLVMEIFYWYDIDLEDDNRLDFEDLLEKALVLAKRRKYLADFIRDKKTDLVNKYVDSFRKSPRYPQYCRASIKSNSAYPIPNCTSGCTREYACCSYSCVAN